MKKQNKPTQAQKKLISYLKKRDSKLSEKEVLVLMNGIRRFVNVVRKIYTEPQAEIIYKDRKIGEKTIKQRVIKTDLTELVKVLDGKKKRYPLIETILKFNRTVTKAKK
ncbi:hypothetical protein KKC08_00660 [Patescibacteria group bacterium]|nr:hypothetical protein [Patescibacteria group bacterium]MCG2701829.1 hypothetical protein [Candidatus Parcubacteria bacterium]MBU4265236.1 hypothetical protein [Patescibacteria group bacterium]MBU4390287.1 hypothetical protein [Patescibacteria group bacterium]MBU4396666.1 hypothetical protein [Patescibacteria group bacterium]